MRKVRQSIGGLGNIMFKQAFLIGQALDAKIPDVYLQGEKYWKQHSKVIKEYFGEGIGKTDKIALHIRRGDYLKADNFHINLWETEYYKNAVRLFTGETFLVFCRDRQNLSQDEADRIWCEKNLDCLNINWQLAPWNEDETEDMNLMASCKGMVMANSSFSWWAAFLNPNLPLIVCPKEWFVDKQTRVELLDDWVKV